MNPNHPKPFQATKAPGTPITIQALIAMRERQEKHTPPVLFISSQAEAEMKRAAPAVPYEVTAPLLETEIRVSLIKRLKTVSRYEGPIPSEADLAAAGANIAAALDSKMMKSVADALTSNAASTVADMPATVLTQSGLTAMLKTWDERTRSMPRPICGVTVHPDAEAQVRRLILEEAPMDTLTALGLDSKIYVLPKQTEQIRVFFDREQLLQHVAEMTLNVGDIVKPTLKFYALRSGGSAYDDAVVASVKPFVLISREGDMKWTATVKPWNFVVTGRADAETMEKVTDRLNRDADGGR